QAREYSEKMAEDMDQFIKATLEEHYTAVVERLNQYHGAIEKMVEELFKTENISGSVVRELITNFEKENGMESKVEPTTGSENKREISEDLSQNQTNFDDKEEK
ncbi:MAG: cell division protein FtsH, partial [Thiovulaceae bacterium]|nr:cell division protein FtsH [Sulfurimonadaceae bacterium]